MGEFLYSQRSEISYDYRAVFFKLGNLKMGGGLWLGDSGG